MPDTPRWKDRDDVSRVMCRTRRSGVCHLSKRHGCPRASAAYPPAMDEQSLTAGIFGLATHGMCGLLCRHRSRWALTPPFHPYRSDLCRIGGCFLSLIPDVTAGFPLGNMPLYVARTFLLTQNRVRRQTSILPFLFYFFTGASVPAYLICLNLITTWSRSTKKPPALRLAPMSRPYLCRLFFCRGRTQL